MKAIATIREMAKKKQSSRTRFRSSSRCSRCALGALAMVHSRWYTPGERCIETLETCNNIVIDTRRTWEDTACNYDDTWASLLNRNIEMGWTTGITNTEAINIVNRNKKCTTTPLNLALDYALQFRGKSRIETLSSHSLAIDVVNINGHRRGWNIGH